MGGFYVSSILGCSSQWIRRSFSSPPSIQLSNLQFHLKFDSRAGHSQIIPSNWLRSSQRERELRCYVKLKVHFEKADPRRVSNLLLCVTPQLNHILLEAAVQAARILCWSPSNISWEMSNESDMVWNMGPLTLKLLLYNTVNCRHLTHSHWT